MNKVVLAMAGASLILGCSATQLSSTAAKRPTLGSGVTLANMDQSARPQDDFYQYVNGGWLKKTEIPADRSNYGTFSILEDRAEDSLREILEEAAQANTPRGSDAQKIGDFYASFMDTAGVEKAGITPLAGELEQINAIKTPRDLARYIGHNQRIGVYAPFAFYVNIDEKNSSAYVSYVFQSGLGLPDRDYYLLDEPRFKTIRDKYRDYARDLYKAIGKDNAQAAAATSYTLEERLAKAQWTRVQNRDAEKTYNRYSLAAAAQLMPNFDWAAFLEGAQATQADTLIIQQPSYFEALNVAIKDVPIVQWQDYFRMRLLNAYAPELPEVFAQLIFNFAGKTLSGTPEQKPRWRRGVQAVEMSIGELAGKVYVERHFSNEAKQRMDRLVGNLRAAYARGIDGLEWMTPQTKRKAHEKLDLFAQKIGFPDKWKDWSALEVRRDDLVGNVMRAAAVDQDRQVARLGGPIDKTEWLMTPQTVNAYYNPPANEIVFPAAILQPPFFDVSADDAINYGAIGAVIGHEISHGFDDQGRKYDGHGNLTDWWTDTDNDEFHRRAQALVKQYSAEEPFPGMHVNGELTLGENIADVSGLAIAYQAYKISLNGRQGPVIDGFTADQRFYIGWAQGWARKYREEEARKRLLTDPHSPGEYRTNVVVSNQAAFYGAFGLKPGDKLYRPPAERVKIW